MRRRMILASFLALLPAVANAQNKKEEKTLRERLQGTWSRANADHYFVIKDATWTIYVENKPLVPSGTGPVVFDEKKQVAVVKTNHGRTWWIFSAGDNVVATETFEKDGSFAAGADGQVFYRKGFELPHQP